MRDRALAIYYGQVKKRMESRFCLPKTGKPPAIKIIGDEPAARGTPLFEPGDWVTWTRPVRVYDGPMLGPDDPYPLESSIARVSKVTQDRPWGSHVYHLRLRKPVELPNEGLRWAYNARLHELQALGAVDLLAQLTD